MTALHELQNNLYANNNPDVLAMATELSEKLREVANDNALSPLEKCEKSFALTSEYNDKIKALVSANQEV